MGNATKTIQYAFGGNRNRTAMVDPDGGRFTYLYDSCARPNSGRICCRIVAV